MSGLRWVAIAGVLVSVALVTPQTGAFSSAAVDRSVTVAVADDDDAFVGIERSPASVPRNQSRSAPLLTVTNRFPSALSLRWNVTDRSPQTRPSLHNASGPATLASGTAGILRAGVSCGSNTAVEHPEITVRASSEDVSVVMNRTVEIGCV